MFLCVSSCYYLTNAITKESSATNSQSASAMMPGVNIFGAASGFLPIDSNHALPINQIQNAAPNNPSEESAKRSKIMIYNGKNKNKMERY